MPGSLRTIRVESAHSTVHASAFRHAFSDLRPDELGQSHGVLRKVRGTETMSIKQALPRCMPEALRVLPVPGLGIGTCQPKLIVLKCATACSGHYPCSGRMIQCQDASVPETILLDFVLFRADACVCVCVCCEDKSNRQHRKTKKTTSAATSPCWPGQKGHTPARKKEETTVTHVGEKWLTRKNRSQVKRKHHPTSCRKQSEA